VRHIHGSAAYLYAILRVLPSFKPRRMWIDGREEEVMFAAFGNSPQYGGGIKIAPAARIDDGQLDACIVHRTSLFQLLITLPRAYTGTHVRKRFVETRRAREFTVDTHVPMDVFADGEPLTTTPARFAIAREKLKIVVSRSA
jgi:diacylglycerol kinase (ATP)